MTENNHVALEPSQLELEQIMQDENNGADSPILSPVQIQQEYFENMSDYDWVNISVPENNHVALEPSQLELEQIMQDENNGADSPILSPVQIQQEYFENISDYDWVNISVPENNHVALEPSQLELEQIMQDENNGADSPILSPVQIQQEYFENMSDYDWVNISVPENNHVALEPSQLELEQIMQDENNGADSPILSPVQIQQEYFENISDYDGVNIIVPENSHVALEPSQLELEQIMQDENNGADSPILSPVQIQQEYFENMSDYDWVNISVPENNHVALEPSQLELEQIMQDENNGADSPILSPVQIQQEYFENISDYDGVNIIVPENSHVALEPSQLELEQIMQDENNGADSPILSPVQIQQEYFENMSDYDWVKYELSDRKYLLQNIAFALFGSPSSEGDMFDLSLENAHLKGYTSRQKERVMNVYDKLCEQSKYSQNDEDIHMSVLLIVCAKPKPVKFYKLEPSNHWLDLHQRTDSDIWCKAVFRVRKCIPTMVGAKTCKVYIDENARVYQDWDSYLTNKTLPKCVIIAPQDGEYQGVIQEGQDAFAVKLTVTPSAALGLTSRVLSSVDTASTVASIGAAGVFGVAAFTPVGPAVLIGATVATVTTGIYGLVRSSLHLHDRRVHEQSISPTDAEARGSWLNIAASSVGLATGAASRLLSKSAAAGTNMTKTRRVLTVSVKVLRHANLVTGGASALHRLVLNILKYSKHREAPTKFELFQFSTATLFFWHAVVSNRTARNIIEDAQATTINEYRSTLRSNRHRKIFDKLSAESRRVQGAVQGNTEDIRGIKNIVNKDQYFADVLKINKDINQHKLHISMTADGQVNLNSMHKFNPSDLYTLGEDGRPQLVNLNSMHKFNPSDLFTLGEDGRALLFSSLGPASVNTSNDLMYLK